MTWPDQFDDSEEASLARRMALPGYSTAGTPRPHTRKPYREPAPLSKRRNLNKAATIADVEFLIEQGETPDKIAERVGEGRTRKEIMRLLRDHWGRLDLSTQLTVEHQTNRRLTSFVY